MDHADLTRLLLRIAGLFGIAMAIGNTWPCLVTLTWVTGNPLDAITLLIGLLIQLSVGLLLMVKAGPIANRLLNDRSLPGPRLDITKLEGAALCVLGWYLLANAIGDSLGLLERASLLFFEAPPGSAMGNVRIDYSGQVCATIVKLLISVAFILGYRRIVGARDRLLTALSSPPAAP
jgi:hypothetical protein